MHILPLQIRFNDIDLMGHVNNAVYFEFFDLGKEHFINTAGVDLYNQDFTIMVVHVESDFRGQVRFKTPIACTTQVTRFGNKSVEFYQEIVEADEHGAVPDSPFVYATCRTIMSGYSRSSASSAYIPDEVKRQLSSV